jgi:hypothetical protein
MSTLMQASREWASRPDDERFVSLHDLQDHCNTLRQNSRQGSFSSRAIEAMPVEDDWKALMIRGPQGGQVAPTHWSFGQLARLANATPTYLNTLPGAVAADCINWGLRQRDVEDIGVLIRKGEESNRLCAATGPKYGRIWNNDVVNGLVKQFGDGVTGDWTVPGEFGKAVNVTKANTTLYASDRDMFVFLADEKNKVEIKNRRGNEHGEMSRGFFCWNSEVGASTFGIATFYFDYVCCNRMVWGAEGFKEVRLRHSSGAPDRFIEQLTPAIENLAKSSMCNIVEAVEKAKAKRIGDADDVHEFLQHKRYGLSKADIKGVELAHIIEEQRPIETLWDATTAVTAYAKTIKWQDRRVELERAGGLIMDLAA